MASISLPIIVTLSFAILFVVTVAIKIAAFPTETTSFYTCRILTWDGYSIDVSLEIQAYTINGWRAFKAKGIHALLCNVKLAPEKVIPCAGKVLCKARRVELFDCTTRAPYLSAMKDALKEPMWQIGQNITSIIIRSIKRLD